MLPPGKSKPLILLKYYYNSFLETKYGMAMT